MKKTIFLLMAICLTSSLFAQKTKVTSGSMALNDGNYEEAIRYLNEALVKPELLDDKSKAKGYAKLGQAYIGLMAKAQQTQDTALIKKYPNAAVDAYDAFQNAKKFDTYKDFTEEINKNMPILGNMTYSTGFMLYQQAAKSASNPAMMKMISGESVKYFRMTTEILPDFYGAQSFLGYSALLNGDSATAQVALEKSIEIWKAKSASKTGAKDSSMTFAYASLYDLYMNGNNKEKAKVLLAEGQSQFPDNKSLKILELNYYLQNGDFQNGIPAFEKAVKDNPTNEDIAIAYANMLEKKGDNDAALKVYQNVLSFSPNSFNANYNLGAMYVNKAAELSKKSNEEKDEKKIMAYQAQIKEQFNLSLPYMEKSHEVAPNDLSVIQALIQITTYLEMNEASMKYITLKKKLASGGK